MAKKRDKIMAELEILKVGYSEEMTDEQLADLLKEAKAKARDDERTAEEKAKDKEPAEIPVDVDYSKARCGLATIHDHEYRLCVIEQRAIRKLEAAVAEMDRRLAELEQ